MRPKIDPEQRRQARLLHGKTIKRVFLCDVGLSNHSVTTNASEPVIEFTDGTTLRLSVSETDSGAEYGVNLYYPARKINP